MATYTTSVIPPKTLPIPKTSTDYVSPKTPPKSGNVSGGTSGGAGLTAPNSSAPQKPTENQTPVYIPVEEITSPTPTVYTRPGGTGTPFIKVPGTGGGVIPPSSYASGGMTPYQITEGMTVPKGIDSTRYISPLYLTRGAGESEAAYKFRVAELEKAKEAVRKEEMIWRKYRGEVTEEIPIQIPKKTPLESAREEFLALAKGLGRERYEPSTGTYTDIYGAKYSRDVYNIPYELVPKKYSGSILPITAEDVLTATYGVYGLAKGGIITGTGILLSKPITVGTMTAIGKIIPRQDTGFSYVGAPSQIARGLLFRATTPLTGTAFAYEFGKNILLEPSKTLTEFGEFITKNPYEVTTATVVPVEKLFSLSIFGKKPEQVTLTPEMERAIEPFTRKTARLFLKTEKGKYVLGGDISIGGGIEKGQTPKQTVIKELREETGLSIKDISQLTYRGKVVFPEETMRIFTANITKEALAKARPMSDIRKIITISPKNLFIREVTGQTALQPISRVSLFPFTEIRSYEAGIINWLETGTRPTSLKITTKYGEYFLGTQSRYDVPYKYQKKYLQQEELLLAHGTTDPQIVRRFYPFEKTMLVKGEKTRRGQAEGLYVQPPTSLGKSMKGYLGLSYLGFKTSQLFESLGVRIGKKPSALIFKEKPSSSILETPKTKAGGEAELLIAPETEISSQGRAQVFSIGLKRVYVQPSKILAQGVKGETTLKKAIEDRQYYYISKEKAVSPTIVISGSEREITKSKSIELSKSLKTSEPSRTIKYLSEPSISNSIEKTPPSISRPSILEITPSISRPSRVVTDLTRGDTTTDITYGDLTFTTSKKINEIRQRKRRLQQIKTYNVLLRKRGKYVPIATGLPRGKALKFGSEKALRDIARTFKIVPTGKSIEQVGFEEEFTPRELQFRTYQVRRGRRMPLVDTFIQRTSANLQSVEEKFSLAQSRRMKNIMSGGLQ